MSNIPMMANLNVVRPAALKQLDIAVAANITPDDLNEIVKAFVSKAKSGSVPAANFVLKLLGAEAVTTIVNNNFYAAPDDSDAGSVGHARQVECTALPTRPPTAIEAVSVYLSVSGSATPETIAEQVGLPVIDVIRVLDSDDERFAVKGNAYSLRRSSTARRLANTRC